MGPSAASAEPFRAVAGLMTGAVACQGGFTWLAMGVTTVRSDPGVSLMGCTSGRGESVGGDRVLMAWGSGLGVPFRPGLDSARTTWIRTGAGERSGSSVGVVDGVAKKVTVVPVATWGRAGGGISALGEASTGRGRASGSVEGRAVSRSWVQVGVAGDGTGIAPNGAVWGPEFTPTFVPASAPAGAETRPP